MNCVGQTVVEDIVVGADAHCLHSAIDAALRGYHNDGDALAIAGNFLQQFQTSQARHLQIGDDNVRRPRRYLLVAFLTITRGFRGIAPRGHQFGQTSAFVLFIFYDQYFFLAHVSIHYSR